LIDHRCLRQEISEESIDMLGIQSREFRRHFRAGQNVFQFSDDERADAERDAPLSCSPKMSQLDDIESRPGKGCDEEAI
jgi:hypothetical protein